MAKKRSGIYVAEIHSKQGGKVYTSYLLRRSYREDGKVKQQTLGNLSHLPREVIRTMRDMLHGEVYVPLHEAVEKVRTRPHGHIAAILAMVNRLGLPKRIDPAPSRRRDLVVAAIVARIAEPQSKLATSRWWATTTLAEDLGVQDATEDELYAAMDWLLERQARIEGKLARRHLQEGGLVLYDVSSSYVEGRHCPLAAFGHNRDRKKGKRQVVYGLMTDPEGRPVAVEVFSGNTNDASTVTSQVTKLKKRFQLERVVLAGDRGMLTSARIETLKEAGGIDWISALRAPDIKRLAAQGAVQLSVFDERDRAEITSPDFPGERLIVCRNPLLAEERARKRRELLAQTEEKLERLVRRVAKGRLKRAPKIGEALGRILCRSKVAKHFECSVREGHFSYRRRQESLEHEARLDGVYILRTSVPADRWATDDAILAYKSLSRAERAFRTLKSVDLKVRPIHHWTADRVKSHIFLCMLAYYVEWHLRKAWAPLLFQDEHPGARASDSPVSPAIRSPKAQAKASTQRTPEGEIVHSFRTLLADLATLTRSEVRVPAKPDLPPFPLVDPPTRCQRKALEAVGANLTGRRQNRTA